MIKNRCQATEQTIDKRENRWTASIIIAIMRNISLGYYYTLQTGYNLNYELASERITKESDTRVWDETKHKNCLYEMKRNIIHEITKATFRKNYYIIIYLLKPLITLLNYYMFY